MNKAWIILVPIVLLVAFGLLYQSGYFKNDPGDTVDYVDKVIKETITDTEYENSSLEEKKDIISDLLSKLKSDKYILNFSYDKNTHQFSFMYRDKTLGGIKLDKLNSKVGDIPIN